jgi:predicted HTH domain antitoxin
MTKREIHLFFKALSRKLKQPAEVIVSGAGAGALMGHVRPSFDIDFEIRLKGKGMNKKRQLLEAAIDEASQEAGVGVNYSENIGGWSMISYLDYRKQAKKYRRIGQLNIKLMSPTHWTIGKMARFLELDIHDMIQVIQKRKIQPDTLIKLWGEALRKSSLSLQCGQFRDHVTQFLIRCGRKTWGKEVNPKKLCQFFEQEIK